MCCVGCARHGFGDQEGECDTDSEHAKLADGQLVAAVLHPQG